MCSGIKIYPYLRGSGGSISKIVLHVFDYPLNQLDCKFLATDAGIQLQTIN